MSMLIIKQKVEVPLLHLHFIFITKEILHFVLVDQVKRRKMMSSQLAVPQQFPPPLPTVPLREWNIIDYVEHWEKDLFFCGWFQHLRKSPASGDWNWSSIFEPFFYKQREKKDCYSLWLVSFLPFLKSH